MSFISLIVVAFLVSFASSAGVGYRTYNRPCTYGSSGVSNYPCCYPYYYCRGYYRNQNSGSYSGSYCGGYRGSTYKPYYQYSPFKNYYTGYLYGSTYYTPSCVQTGYSQFGSSNDFYYYQHVYSNDGLYQRQFNTCYKRGLPCYVSSGKRYFSTCTTLQSPCANYCGQGQYCSQNSHFRSFTCVGGGQQGFGYGRGAGRQPSAPPPVPPQGPAGGNFGANPYSG